MTKYVVANWKSHKSLSEAKSWLTEFLRWYRPNPQLKVIIAPSTVYLSYLDQLLQEQGDPGIALAIQDLSPFPLGSYTGEIAAAMVRDLVEFAILGHSERRRYFNETNQDIANKVREASGVGIKPIVCVDEPYARAQLAAIDEEYLKKILIGYGPVEAIGINTPQTTKKALQAITRIKELAPDAPLLYGGSINAENAVNYLNLSGVAGLMVGTASLDAEEFARICTIVGRSR